VIVAAIDLGTNTTRLLVADVDDNRLTEVHRETRITGLGEGVDARGRLLPVPIARVRNALSDYRQTLEQLGAERTLAVATSAVRDAENGEAFLGEVEWSYGFKTRLLSGDEEAAMTLRGVGPLEPGTVVIDVGGGSTELILGAARGVHFSTSLQAGAVRYSERHLHTDPPTQAELSALAADLRATIDKDVPAEIRRGARTAIAVAGTATSCAAIDQALDPYDPTRVHGYTLDLTTLRLLLARLAAMPLAERRHVRGLNPDRAPTIVAGASILIGVLEAFELAAFEVSEHDILRGVALSRAGFA
jgi:exopolyphosphatase/guanosine-5'-triphosphate,3'-diphosphate pyrophosphatase